MGKNNESLVIGIILGILGLAVVASIFKREARCPVCNSSIPIGTSRCSHCRRELKWT